MVSGENRAFLGRKKKVLERCGLDLLISQHTVSPIAVLFFHLLVYMSPSAGPKQSSLISDGCSQQRLHKSLYKITRERIA